VQVGELLSGKYRIQEMIAVGGMGLVAKARHEILGQNVAIKFLLPRPGADDAAPRFLREARAAAQIQNPHVVHVFDCGELENGVPYMVMEHLEGVELSREMRERGAISVEEAVDITLDALEGVAAAHAVGIVHRDLKPSNLFLVDDPGGARRVKVLDFGISKVRDDTVGEDLTRSMILGSPRYISPEQAQSSRDVDTRTDIWSIGVIVYQMIAGEAPFQGDTVGQLVAQILLHTPERLDRRRPEVPKRLADAVARCLQRDREARFSDVGELAQALVPFASDRGRAQAARVEAILQTDRPARVRLEADAEPPASTGTVGTWTQLDRGERRASRIWLVGVAAALIVGGYAGWRWQGERARTEEPVVAPAATEEPTAQPTAETATTSEPTKDMAQPEQSASAPLATPLATPLAPKPIARPVSPKVSPVPKPVPPPAPVPTPVPTPPKDVLQHSD